MLCFSLMKGCNRHNCTRRFMYHSLSHYLRVRLCQLACVYTFSNTVLSVDPALLQSCGCTFVSYKHILRKVMQWLLLTNLIKKIPPSSPLPCLAYSATETKTYVVKICYHSYATNVIRFYISRNHLQSIRVKRKQKSHLNALPVRTYWGPFCVFSLLDASEMEDIASMT